MRVAVIGSGGREHALVKSLNQSDLVKKVYSIPGSAGIDLEAQSIKIDLSNHRAVLETLESYKIDFVVIGPEAHIVDGLSDYLRDAGVLVVAPSFKASQLEASKKFAKEFMQKHQIPTAKYQQVENLEEVMAAEKSFTAPYVLKVDGLAAGKGVFICHSKDELQQAASKVFVERAFGNTFAIMEEFLEGWELSYLVITNGESYSSLCLAQDHKQLLDNDQGPNTGGMGVVAPLAISTDLQQQIENELVRPSVEGLKKDNLFYRGLLYIGVMVTKAGPKVLEYNVRFGDPEAQVILPLLNGDWGEVFYKLSQGEVMPLNWKDQFAACVVLAAPGYPEAPEKNIEIHGNVETSWEGAYFVHAGTKKNMSNQWFTNGGRVLNAIGVGKTKPEAINKAYELIHQVRWDNMQFRKDIGKRENKL